MLRISKLTDYAIVLLSLFTRSQAQERNARELAGQTQLPLPTVSKILKTLCRGGLLVSRRGASGGYTLARPPEEISIAEVIAAIEGPIALTDCSTDAPSGCDFEPQCPVRANWRRINRVVQGALAQLKLTDMAGPAEAHGGCSQQAEPVLGSWSELKLLVTRKRGDA
jgi:FeS assembly SUF system regulator